MQAPTRRSWFPIRGLRAEEGSSIERLAERFSVSRSSVYRALKLAPKA
ncbi:helix-turn-helix domain-containing protein [Stenotrophomonas maltophilia]|nr:helix-turn-helix domain-containing protein [Stenotrophomonas maltophilia]MBA0251211.1 HTH domain-containing protein [Stenotrophomonas maltophilia]MBA0319384.1 HTH domain-containing protein [Stenotrophomonas maltophilia]MCU1146186.1 helix-turn-helix domain-containing protein [Stenotrophomonas maltophilia]QGL93444.1 HTH domain-containing protein [Stenotrophomonas maltophilia]HEL4147623.1 helix-turn-helix domain-containing protein [Stenotrophomonas maltophilia]